jgi:hypothetical protein
MRKLDKPVEQFGERVTEEVGRVTFTADGEANAIGLGQVPGLRAIGHGSRTGRGPRSGSPRCRPLAAGKWCAGSGRRTRRSPAPQVELTAAEPEGGAAEEQAAQQQAPAAGDDDDDSSNTLSIIALIVGIAGLAAGFGALLMARGRTRV